MTGNDIIKEIGKKGLKKLPKSKLPKSTAEFAALIVSTHIKNRKEGGPILLTKVFVKDDNDKYGFYYGVMNSVDSNWYKVDRDGANCQCSTPSPCMHEIAILLALKQKIQIPTFEDLLKDDKTPDEDRRLVHRDDL